MGWPTGRLLYGTPLHCSLPLHLDFGLLHPGQCIPGTFAVMASKRYNHPYTDGELVTDLEQKETFVFMDKNDGWRAQAHPKLLRAATEEEKVRFATYSDPARP